MAMARSRSRPGYVRPHQPLRVLGGIILMLGSVAVTFAILTQYAGAWGVPYFSFMTDRGSKCTNDLTGYTCSPMTLADVEYFGDVDLPDDSSVVTGTYHSTHDYQMEAVLEVPGASAEQALADLNQAFGNCSSELPSPLSADGMQRHLRNGERRCLQRIGGDEQPALLDRHWCPHGWHTAHRNGDQVPLTAALARWLAAHISGDS